MIYKNSKGLSYYVYAYLRRSDLTPYYIGKGHGNRAFSPDHTVKIPTDTRRIVILCTRLTELGAFAIERRLIAWYGRKDLGTGILRNLTDGGEGGSGRTISDSHKMAISQKLKGKSRPDVSDRLRGKPKSDLHKQKISQSQKGVARPSPSTESIKKSLETRRLNGTLGPTAESIKKGIETRKRNGTLGPTTSTIEKIVNTRRQNGSYEISSDSIKKMLETTKNYKWYTDGFRNKRCENPPGPEWKPGYSIYKKAKSE